MPTIAAAVDKLIKFSDQKDIPKIVKDLQNVQALSPDQVSDTVIEDLRKELKGFLSQKNIKKDNGSLADAAYDGLLALAEFKPINEEDLITQIQIQKEDKVFVSTGHQFSLINLIHYHNARGPLGITTGETSQSKWLVNPMNVKFEPMDVAHISAIAKERGITIENLKPEALAPQGVAQTRLPASFSTVINGVLQFFRQLFNARVTQAQTPQEDRPFREDDFIEEREEFYAAVFSVDLSPLSQPTSAQDNIEPITPSPSEWRLRNNLN